jgi:hypothetical protein
VKVSELKVAGACAIPMRSESRAACQGFCSVRRNGSLFWSIQRDRAALDGPSLSGRTLGRSPSARVILREWVIARHFP